MVEKIKEGFGWLILFVFNMLGVGWSILGMDSLAIGQATSLLFAMIFLIIDLSADCTWAAVLAGLLYTANILSSLAFFGYIFYIKGETLKKIKEEFFAE